MEDDEEKTTIWFFNLISMEQNGGFLIGKKADAIIFQEHKLKRNAMKWVRNEYRKRDGRCCVDRRMRAGKGSGWSRCDP